MIKQSKTIIYGFSTSKVVFPPKENTKTHRSSCEIWMVSRASSKARMGSGASSWGDYLGNQKLRWTRGKRLVGVFFAAYIIIYFIPCFKGWGESTKTCTCIHSSFVECFSLNKDVVVLVGSYFTCCWVTVFFSITCFFPRHPEFMAVSLFALHVP